MKQLYKNEKWLKRCYLDKEYSQEKLRKILGCSQPTIRNWLRRHDIPERTKVEREKLIMKENENRLYGSAWKQLGVSYRKYFYGTRKAREV